MSGSALARRIEMTGWSTVLLGVVCLGLAAIQAATPILLRRFAAVLDDPDDPMREAWAAGAGEGAWANGLFGVALVAIGIAVGRRARWAHAALTISCWVSIAVVAILAKPSLAPFFALAGNGASAGLGMLVASAVLLVAQIAAVLWFLRFWRRPEVRAAFRVLAVALFVAGGAIAADPPPPNNMFAQWSPDGKQLVFTSDRGGDSEIFVMDADGSSPLFQSPRDGGDVNIFAMNDDGGDPVQLTWLKGFAGVPVYSPDDRNIAFQWRPGAKPGDASRKWVICVMASDGSRLRVITDGRFNDQVPNWSKNGKKLLFRSTRWIRTAASCRP